MSLTNKKIIIFYILEIFKKYSDENHLLMQQDIIDKLLSIYNVEAERKKVADDINILIDVGFDIIKVTNKGYFLGERDFDKSEITFLIDALLSSKSIDGKHAKDLISKINRSLSQYDRIDFGQIYKTDSVVRSQNKDIFFNIEIINEAIKKGKKISFQYLNYGLDKKLYPKKNGKRYWVSPYFMVNNSGKYFLVCSNYNYPQLINYKIDLISDIRVEDKDIKDIKSIPGYKNGVDIPKYINEKIYMFTSEAIVAKFKVLKERGIYDLMEWFGDLVHFKKVDEEIFATVKADEKSLVYWALQYGSDVKVLEPSTLLDKIKEKVNELNNLYINKLN